LKRTLAESASAASSAIKRAEAGINLTNLKRDDNGAYNIVRDLISFAGILAKDGTDCRVTPLGEIYKRLNALNEEDSWRWLVTRTLWLYTVPNGTNVAVNRVAANLGVSFSFFQLVLGLLWHLSALSGEDRYLSYEELCILFDDDQNWQLSSQDLFKRLLDSRAAGGHSTSNRGLLEDLEGQYQVPRDNLNTVLNKAFQQTGLFDYRRASGRNTGISLSGTLDRVLHGRIRFVLDHAASWNNTTDWSEYLQPRSEDLPEDVSALVTEPAEEEPSNEPIAELAVAATAAFRDAGLRFDEELVRRFAASLLAKRFVILTGLSGSGKTKLAQAFAAWLSPSHPGSGRHFEVVPVGADWTAKESSLGYADAINVGKYVRTTPILDLILKAHSDPELPYFLVLDEMNLSHVERYFADFLSAIESGEEIPLHSGLSAIDGVPPTIALPLNLFIIGTVNVDETTYVFSPKVLDRSNSIEFRVRPDQMLGFLNDPSTVALQSLRGGGVKFSKSFVVESARTNVESDSKDRIVAELSLFFDVLTSFGNEFGFRTANEITRFVYFHQQTTEGSWDVDRAIDAQLCQKLLPRLNGSRRRIEPVLCALAVLCYRQHVWSDVERQLTNRADLLTDATTAGRLDEALHPLLSPSNFSDPPSYPLTFDKIARMLTRLATEGFTSFAEA
jgi:MoxR-like ATPase